MEPPSTRLGDGRAERELQQLAYAASHDLKEPLRAITGYLRLLEARFGDALEGDGRRFVAGAVEGAERMDAMVSGLLAYSRAGAVELNPEDVDAGELVEDVLEGLRAAGELDGAEVIVEDLPLVRADRAQLRTVFSELIANALRFRGEAAPRIRIAADTTLDGWSFSVEDNGIGIDPALAARVFQVFGRLHTREEYEGTGMGLAVCRTVVERHGGTITVAPAEGGGSRFRFTLAD